MKKLFYELLCPALAKTAANAPDINLYADRGLRQKSINLTAGTQDIGAGFNFSFAKSLSVRLVQVFFAGTAPQFKFLNYKFII